MKILIAFGVMLALVVIVGGVAFGYVNGIWNEGIAMEKQLSAQYLDNQNYLSEFMSGFYEQASVATAKRDAIDKILTDAVKGRYDKGGFQIGSAFFVAIKEAYPDLSKNLDVYDRLIDYIQSKRTGYRAVQSKLLDQVRVYDTWRQTGILRRFIVQGVGFPTKNLEARVGDVVITGDNARQKMLQIVLTADAVRAYETGKFEPLKMPK